MAGREDIHAFLGVGAEFEGVLRFEGMVRMDCRFQGTVESQGVLALGEKAEFTGEIRIGQLVTSGAIHGDVVAQHRVVLQKGSRLVGNLTTPLLDMEEGAVFEGRLIMDGGREASREAGKSKAAPPARPDVTVVTAEIIEEGADSTGSNPRKPWYKF